MPTKTIADSVLDAALNDIKNTATRLSLCERAPTTFTQATSNKGAGGNVLAIVTIDNTDFTGPAAGDVSGRKLTVAQQTGLTGLVAGAGDHIALVDFANSELLAVTPEDAERSNTCQAGGTTTTAVLDTGASAVDDHYNGMTIEILTGTGAGGIRTISDYVGASKTATVDATWTAPDATSTFTIYGRPISVSDSITVNAFDIEINDPT